MVTRDLESARQVVSRAEREALEAAERLRVEAEELLEEARAEAARLVDRGCRDAAEAASLRRQLIEQMVMLRDALERADEGLEEFLASVSV
jgi:vacuolar-type H+-ATPase subunit E/Vma4